MTVNLKVKRLLYFITQSDLTEQASAAERGLWRFCSIPTNYFCNIPFHYTIDFASDAPL